jgi:hypothetical protein
MTNVLLEKGDAVNRIHDLEVSQHGLEIVKRDTHGLPLIPQPSDYSDDPLVSGFMD